MMKSALSMVSFVLCGVLPAIPAGAADKPEAARPAAAKIPPSRSTWPAENLSGKIISVSPEQKLVVVKCPDGVPFDMVVTPKSRITHGSRSIALKDLARFRNDDVVIRFIPERRGDVVEWMRIGS